MADPQTDPQNPQPPPQSGYVDDNGNPIATPVPKSAAPTSSLPGPYVDDLGNPIPTNSPDHPEHPAHNDSFLKKAWDWANKGLISGDTLMGATGRTRAQNEEDISGPPLEGESPLHAGVRAFGAGLNRDVSDTLSGFTSPAAIAMAGAGAATRALPAVAKVAPAIGKALQIGTKVARPIEAAASAMYAGEGAKEMVDPGKEGETTPDMLQRRLGAGSKMAGGAAGFGDAAMRGARGTQSVAQSVASSKPVAKSLFGGGSERMAGVPAPNPAEGPMTRGEVAQYAADHGIDLLPGQATGSRPLQTLQGIGERSLFGSEELRNHLDGQKVKFADTVNDFQERLDPQQVGATEEGVGRHLQEQTKTSMDALKKSAQQDFDTWRQQTGDVPVDISSISEKWAPRAKEFAKAAEGMPASYARPTQELMGKLSNLGVTEQAPVTIKMGGIDVEVAKLPPESGKIDIATAQALRSAYYDVAHDYSGNVPKRVNAMAAEAVSDLDSAMEKAAQQAGSLDTWRSANAKWREMHEKFNDSKSPLYQVLQQGDPIQAPGKILQQGTTGGRPQSIRMLKDAGVDLAPVKRQLVQNIADKKFSTDKGRLGGYSQEFLKEAFNPDELKELYTLGRISRAIGFETNPSGTAGVMLGVGQLKANILEGTAGKMLGAAKLTMDPRFIRATTGITPVRLGVTRTAAPQPAGRGWAGAAAAGRSGQEP